MKNIIPVLRFAFSVLSLLFYMTGCERDMIDDPGENRPVMIYLSAPSLSSSLKSTTPANHAEGLINEALLYSVNNLNDIVDTFLVKSINGGIQRYVHRNIKSFYAIANPTPAIKAVKPATLSALLAFTADFTNVPASPFLMSGKGDVAAGAQVEINLERAVAKVEIINEIPGFVITSVKATNMPAQGYVFKQASFAVPAASNATYTVSGSTLYVPENAGGNNATKFTVTGTLSGVTKSYDFSLMQSGDAIEIHRNKLYTVSIKAGGEVNLYEDGIKILAIGNSYSQDAMRYLFDLLVQSGINQNGIKLVTAYIGGGTLKQHATNAKNNITIERNNFIAKGIYNNTGMYTLKQLIEEDKWDIITLQQYSEDSGKDETYNEDLDYLIDIVHTNMTDNNNPKRNPNYKLGWHMTWAYTSPHYIIYYYGGRVHGAGTQRSMYDSICHVVQRKIILKKDGGAFDFIIPTGTAIQNARAPDLLGDILNRDGSHLNNLGAYIAAAMWVKTITGYDIAGLKVPYTASAITAGTSQPFTTDITTFGQIKQAVNDARLYPFQSPPPP